MWKQLLKLDKLFILQGLWSWEKAMFLHRGEWCCLWTQILIAILITSGTYFNKVLSNHNTCFSYLRKCLNLKFYITASLFVNSSAHLFTWWYIAVIFVQQQEPKEGGVGGELPCGPGVGPAAMFVLTWFCHFLLKINEKSGIFKTSASEEIKMMGMRCSPPACSPGGSSCVRSARSCSSSVSPPLHPQHLSGLPHSGVWKFLKKPSKTTKDLVSTTSVTVIFTVLCDEVLTRYQKADKTWKLTCANAAPIKKLRWFSITTL